MSRGPSGAFVHLPGRTAVRHAASDLLPDHPWPPVATADAIVVTDGTAVRGPRAALAWRGGNPWNPQGPTLHVLGNPSSGAQLIEALAGPGDHVLTTPEILDALDIDLGAHEHGGVGRYEWDLRTVRAPLLSHALPDGATIGWLPDGPQTDAELHALLDEAFIHAALRPGDPRAGRWCGVRQGDALVACAAQTLPAAPIAHLSSLAVRPAVRAHGLGALLTAYFVAEAFAAGAPFVVLAVDGDNTAGIALYDRLGFDTWHLAGITIPLGAS